MLQVTCHKFGDESTPLSRKQRFACWHMLAMCRIAQNRTRTSVGRSLQDSLHGFRSGSIGWVSPESIKLQHSFCLADAIQEGNIVRTQELQAVVWEPEPPCGQLVDSGQDSLHSFLLRIKYLLGKGRCVQCDCYRQPDDKLCRK